MKTVFDKQYRDELATRIDTLTEGDKPLWGKMTVCQMVKHCALWQEWVLLDRPLKRVFMGRLLGRMLLKKEMQSEVMRKNNPSSPELIVTDTDLVLDQERGRLTALIAQYGTYAYPANGMVHPFFGKMTKEQLGYFTYKHLDHHLRQFGR